jgi:transcriptional regulator with XRE-family HTH domain
VLRDLREAKQMKREELAALAGVCAKCLEKSEEKRCNPKHETLLRLCAGLALSYVVVAIIVESRREGITLPLDRVLRHVRALKRFLPAGREQSSPDRRSAAVRLRHSVPLLSDEALSSSCKGAKGPCGREK